MTKAQARIGQRVRSLRDFANVPKGTEGVIDEEYSLKPGEACVSGVMVAWDLPEKPLPQGYQRHDGRPAIQHGLLRDGFDLDDELQFPECV